MDDDTRRRIQRERTARYRARKRGEDVPRLPTGPKPKPIGETKTCADCGVEKPVSEFYMIKQRTGRRPHSYCKQCCRDRSWKEEYVAANQERLKRRYWANPEEFRARQRRYRQDNLAAIRQRDRERYPQRKAAERLRKYGVPAWQYQALMTAQGDACAICGGDVGGLAVDHDHETGVVRGLLCRNCNVGLGLLGDTLSAAQAAARYLSDPPASRVIGDGTKPCQLPSSSPIATNLPSLRTYLR